MLSEMQLHRQYNCSRSKLERARLKGLIKPVKATLGEANRYQYNEEEVVHILGLNKRESPCKCSCNRSYDKVK